MLIFGFFHGFGLATKLQDFALARDGLVPNIVAFNVGVEIGQLLALGAILRGDGALAADAALPAPGLRRQRRPDDLRVRADGLSDRRVRLHEGAGMSTVDVEVPSARWLAS